MALSVRVGVLAGPAWPVVSDCNTFCTKIGTGGTCPSCDEPITLDELLLDRQPSTCPQ